MFNPPLMPPGNKKPPFGVAEIAAKRPVAVLYPGRYMAGQAAEAEPAPDHLWVMDREPSAPRLTVAPAWLDRQKAKSPDPHPPDRAPTASPPPPAPPWALALAQKLA